jgi:hypothetical protein
MSEGSGVVDDLCRVFPYEKSVMLNVLYDTIDHMGYRTEHANSERGTIAVLSPEPDKRSIRIALNSIPNEKGSIVRVLPEIEDCIGEQLSKVLLDEIAATIQRSMSKCRR